MGFFSNFWDDVSGETRRDFEREQMDRQAELYKLQLEQDEKEAALKYSPEAQKTVIVKYIIVGVIFIVIVIVLIRLA